MLFVIYLVGPFIIYEYCEHGPLKDYLLSQKSNVTLEVQESLFRFGLDIAKGMEYLASKGVSLQFIVDLNHVAVMKCQLYQIRSFVR